MRIIKRYSNRKLYDTKESRYCTLEQLAGIVRAGEDVQVLTHDGGADLTSAVLLQAMHDQQRREATYSPGGLMRVLRSPSSL